MLGAAKKKVVTEEDTDVSNRSEVVVLEEEEEDEDANDHVRLWEDGWKQRYYKIKFNVEEEDFEFRRKIVSDSIRKLTSILLLLKLIDE